MLWVIIRSTSQKNIILLPSDWSGPMNKYLEEGLIKSEYIFYKSIINRWSFYDYRL